MVNWRNTPEYKLAWLCELLEAGDSIPTELAGATATYIREAIEKDGKLPLGRKSGRKSAGGKQLGRACDVAKLVIVDKKKVADAIDIVADAYGLRSSTVKKDYGICGRYAREIVRSRSHWPELCQLGEELKQLLLTFRDSNGCPPTVEEVEEIVGSLPAQSLRVYVDKIRDGQFTRDIEFFGKVFAPMETEGT